MSARLRLRGLLVLVAIGASLFAFARPAAAESDAGYFVNAINAIRASRGLGTLAVDGQLTAVAQGWSQVMAGQGGISHNPNLGSQISGWRTAGENVGTGSDDASIEAAFENSPHHFENMVDPNFNYIGVGVVRDASGTLWVTEDFKQSSTTAKAAAPAPRPAAPKPAPRPAPKPAAAPRPVAAPVHAAPAHISAAPKPAPAAAAPVAATVATTPATTVPVSVLATNARAAAPSTGLAVTNPFTAANLMGLVALVALGASMAIFARVRVRAASQLAG